MKKRLTTLFVIFCSVALVAQEKSYQLSTHILDISNGQPAPNVKVELEKVAPDGSWEAITVGKTNESGRINNFLPKHDGGNQGIYKLTFRTKPYFKDVRQVATFYPFVVVVFEITDDKHYHVPITLSPFGYSTYRGN